MMTIQEAKDIVDNTAKPVIWEAKGWLYDIGHIGSSRNITDIGAVRVTDRAYEGGWAQFAADTASLA